MCSSQPICRINNKSFLFNTAEKREVRLHLPKELDAETRFYLAGKAQKILAKGYDLDKMESLRFRFGNKKWKLIPMSRMNRFCEMLYKILAYIFPFFHPPAVDNIARFKIEKAWFGPSSKKTKKARLERDKLQTEWKKKTGLTFARTNFKRSEKGEACRVSKEEYQKGVRGSLPLDFSKGGKYEDPFTTLATLAFQRFESSYVSYDFRKQSKQKEKITPLSSDYRIVLVGNALKLVHRSNRELVTEENLQKGKKAYIDFIQKEYGEEKVRYISSFYGLNFDQPEGELTPEHIYRFNIGTTNLEIQDVEQFLSKLKSLKIESEKSVDEILAKSSLTLSERKGLLKALKSDESEISLEKLQGWVEKYKDFSCKEMDPVSFNALIECLFPDGNEIERAYTGRKIIGMIGSAYTTAEKEFYKPWIDQAELTQIFGELKTCPSMAAYHELLAHVVVKKHLCREHPDEQYRVGALIPAPPEKKGEGIRWYKVSSCISNGYIHSYTLERACKDESLREDIKVYRSTASSRYAMNSHKSLINDANHLNPPGKMGINLLEPYEKDFFRDRTIPVWVAYQHLAEKKLVQGGDLEAIYSLLNIATKKLVEQKARKDRKLTFREILKRHDVILEEFYSSGAKILPEERHKNHFKHFPRLFRKLLKRYGQITEGGVKKLSDDIVKQDAAQLQKFLKGISSEVLDERERLLCQALVQDLDRHILEAKKPDLVETYLEAFDFQMLEQRQRYLEAKQKNSAEAKEALQKWSQILREMAVSLKEDIDTKLARNIVCTGHSLGGGCAQGGFTHYVTEEERCPLPGYWAGLFLYDDTKIDRGANKQFKRFLIENIYLMEELGIKYRIFRRQEYGDFVPLGGREHLGSTFNDNEMKELAKVCEFDAAIVRRLKTSKNHNIAGAGTIHAGRFQGGIIGSDYEETPYSTKEQGIFDNEGRGCSDMSAEDAKHFYRRLYRDVWGLSTVYQRVLTEEQRRSTSNFWRLLRRWIVDRTTHPVNNQALDQHGCLIVNLAGGK